MARGRGLTGMKPKNSPAGLYEVRPSDLSQAIFRVALVSCVVVWTAYIAASFSVAAMLDSPVFQFSILYWLLSVAVLIWTASVLHTAPVTSKLYGITRTISVFLDVGAASFYTAISGEAGIILYPVYLTMSIGYGYRFGVRYLYLALGVSALFFSFAAKSNPYIGNNPSLLWAYYLGMILVPLYSASLLNKHREVLARIREVNSARSRFIANMSHELRTPLHAIISVSDLLTEEAENERFLGTRHKLRMISDSAQHLLNLVNRVLDVASADAGGMGTVNPQPIDLEKTVLSSVRICQPNAESKGLNFYWYYDVQMPLTINSSSEYLQEIIINTVGNAIKYTNTGYVYVGVRVLPNHNDNRMIIEVTDTGIGISAKLLPTIFEPFTLGDDSAARRYAGTGLGLTLTKQFIEALNGDIKFDSVEGVGTRCVISLPCHAQDNPDPPKPPTRECYLLTPRSIEPTEIETFTSAGWKCHVVSALPSPNKWANDLNALFIDTEFGAHLETVVDNCMTLDGRRMLVLYTKPAGYSNLHRLGINSVVRRGMEMDLRAAARLSAAMFDSDGVEIRTQKTVSLKGYRILIADDNHTNLRSARLALNSIGAATTTVDSGEKALAELESGDYDIAFVDLHMPGMSGIEVTQIYQYFLTDTRTPIVILTADATEAAKEEAQLAGSSGFLTKPLRVSDLRGAVLEYALEPNRGKASEGHHAVLAEPVQDNPGLLDKAIVREFVDLGVSEDELDTMLADFVEDSQALIESWRKAARLRDHSEVRAIAHSLKGACATLGARRLKERINEITKTENELAIQDHIHFCDELSSLLERSAKELRENMLLGD